MKTVTLCKHSSKEYSSGYIDQADFKRTKITKDRMECDNDKGVSQPRRQRNHKCYT